MNWLEAHSTGDEYGRERCWGAVGYGLAAIINGVGTKYTTNCFMFQTLLVSGILSLIMLKFLPRLQRNDDSGNVSFFTSLCQIIQNSALVKMFVFVFLQGDHLLDRVHVHSNSLLPYPSPPFLTIITSL